jgi:hypothetical protein
MTRPSHSRFYYPNNIWWWVPVIKFLVITRLKVKFVHSCDHTEYYRKNTLSSWTHKALVHFSIMYF